MPERKINTKEEISKLNTAIDKLSEHLDGMYEISVEEFGEQNAEIFAAQKLILNDTGFFASICNQIEGGLSASLAVEAASKEYIQSLSNIPDEVIRAKIIDIQDISKRLINVINGNALYEDKMDSYEGVIYGDELTPSDIFLLDKTKVHEIVFCNASEFSHTVVLAKARGINVRFINEHPESITEDIVKSTGVQRKKVLRTEYLYMNRAAFPNEEEQIKAYLEYIVNASDSDECTNSDQNVKYPVIRIFDVGADKASSLFEEKELELTRGVRKALKFRDVLAEQVRAIIKAVIAADNEADVKNSPVGILIPMVSSVLEVSEVKEIIDKEIEKIQEETGVDNINEKIKLGLMIETPAAAIISDKLSHVCDFFMLGVNDLLQYTYACDRNSKDLGVIYKENPDSIARMIDIVKENAKNASILVNICS